MLAWAIAKAHSAFRELACRVATEIVLRHQRTATLSLTQLELARLLAGLHALGATPPALISAVVVEVSKMRPEIQSPLSFLALLRALTQSSPTTPMLHPCAHVIATRINQNRDAFTFHQMITMMKLVSKWMEVMCSPGALSAVFGSLASHYRQKFLPQCKTSVDVVLLTEALSQLLPYGTGIEMHRAALSMVQPEEMEDEGDLDAERRKQEAGQAAAAALPIQEQNLQLARTL